MLSDSLILSMLWGALWRGALAAAIGVAALRLLGRPAGVRTGAFLALGVGMASLAFHPFPDPASLDCSGGGQIARVVPFHMLERAVALWESGAGLGAWLRDRTVATAAANFAVFAGLGWLAAPWAGGRVLAVAAAGLGYSLFLEIAQGTGLFGIYPCPYRSFDVDDLITNTLGALAGAALARLR